MGDTDHETAVEELKEFARTWNAMYVATAFEDMKELATVDVAIANVGASKDSSGMIFGRQAYYDGIVGAYAGKNLLVMQYECWEYIPLGDNMYYTIGVYTLQGSDPGVNCWLLRRESATDPWRIFRVINN